MQMVFAEFLKWVWDSMLLLVIVALLIFIAAKVQQIASAASNDTQHRHKTDDAAES